MTAAVPEPRPALLRVADAPPLPRHRAGSAIQLGSALLPYQILLVMLLIHFSSFLLAPGLAMIQPAMVIARYLLWPCILVAAAAHLHTRDADEVLLSLRPWMPFLLAGIISGLAGTMLGGSLRQLAFWSLGTLGAAVVAAHLPADQTMRLIRATFLTFVVCSVAFTLVFPEWGLQPDGRSKTGYSWLGLFTHKNQLGQMCAYASLFTLVVPGLRRSWRAVLLALSWFALWKSSSQSSIIVVLVQMAYAGAVLAIRRRNWPTATSVLALLGLSIVVPVVILLAKAPALALLGRDTTLSGRSDIWRMWLARASEHWFLGTGPGTFTSIGSPSTTDLTLALQANGLVHHPHNIYIATFGELGIVGLVALVVPLLATLLLAPFRTRNHCGLLSGAIALTMLFNGLSETLEVFGLGLNMTLLIMAATAARALSRPAATEGSLPA